MKTYKAFTAIILFMIIAFSTLIPATATQERNDDYDFLLESGFSSDYLDGLSDEMLKKMAEIVTQKSGAETISDFDYLLSCGYPEELLKAVSDSAMEHIASLIEDNEVSRVDYETENSTGIEDVTLKRATAQLKNKETDKIAGELICLYWEWPENKPLIREEDYISVMWNKDAFCYKADSFYAEDYWRQNKEDAWTVSDTYTKLAHADMKGIGHWTDLDSFKNHVGGVMVFKLKPTSPIEANKEYKNVLNIYYEHKTEQTAMAVLCCLLFLIVLFVVLVITKKRRQRKGKI